MASTLQHYVVAKAIPVATLEGLNIVNRTAAQTPLSRIDGRRAEAEPESDAIGFWTAALAPLFVIAVYFTARGALEVAVSLGWYA